MSRLWDKGTTTDRKVIEFTVGEDFELDARLVRHDVRASIAHVRMLGAQGLLAPDEVIQLESALHSAAEDFLAGRWSISREDEDCHTALENYLTQAVGYLGGKVHLGRSRNDQVLTAMRLYLRSEIIGLHGAGNAVAAALELLADSQGGSAMPGYTHLQQAMPSSVGDWARGYAAEIRDSLTLLSGADHLAAKNPLGSAAGYGTPGLNLDRTHTTQALGFEQTQNPVTACQLSRGKAESALAFALTQVLQDVGRLSADICLFASQEFAFVKLADDVSTGSSIMPQKRNPDVFELLRAHSAQAPADLLAILSLTAKMTSGYHRDLQLIKPPLFRLIDRSYHCLEVAAHALTRIEFDAKRMTEATDPGIHAAEAAFRLVQTEGISFREAYQRIAKA
jgi:argininosuccinate lyase